MVRMGHKNLNLVYAGGYDGCFGLMGPPDYGTRHVEDAAAFKKEWEKKGTTVDAGGDCMMGGIATLGGGATIVWENFTCWDPHDRESTDGAYEFFDASSDYGVEKHWGSGMERGNIASRGDDGYETPREVRERILSASPQPEVYHYQRKIREAFNPNNLGDAYYLTL